MQVRSGTNISRSNPEAVQRNLDQRPAIWEPPATFEAARVVAIVVLEHPGSGCTPASPANDPENQLHRARALNDHWPFESNCVEKRCRGFHLSQPRSLYKHSRCHFLKWIELFFLHEEISLHSEIFKIWESLNGTAVRLWSRASLPKIDDGANGLAWRSLLNDTQLCGPSISVKTVSVKTVCLYSHLSHIDSRLHPVTAKLA